ncbi:MAG: GC-type dockerin domain-anchored protein, partial [Phycisphaerales bacterium]
NNSASIQANNGCALTIAPGITCRTDSGNTGSSSIAFYMAWNGSTPGTIRNQGIIRASGNAARSISFNHNGGTGNAFTNEGTLEANSGGDIAINANITGTSSGEVIVGPGSTFTVASAATFTLTGAGRITHQINGGGTATTTFGRVIVHGTMNLAGVIRVQYVNGYNPQGCRGAVTLIGVGTGTNPPPAINGGFTSGQVPPKPNGLRAAVGTSDGNIFFASTNRGDVASLGGALVPDGLLTADDVIAYLNAFFSGNLAIADVASLGGTPNPDGQLTPDDIIVFLDAFFAGCPQ